jgi:hypothetical protein
MERMERINSSFDLEYDYYKKNIPAIERSEDNEESIDLYEKIFAERKQFTVLGLDSYIILSKKSLNKIANMIDAAPQEYVLFTEHQIVDEDKFDKLLEKEGDKLNPILIPEPEKEEGKNEVIKNEDNIEDIINDNTYKICSYLYLFLILCSICNLLFIIYYMVKTGRGIIFFTIYTMFLFAFLLFTGIYGFIKCKQNDFTGCVLKCSTFLVPISGIFAIIIYFASAGVPLSDFWMKLILDIITVIIGVILILYLTGLIKTKKKYDIKTEVLLNNEDVKA